MICVHVYSITWAPARVGGKSRRYVACGAFLLLFLCVVVTFAMFISLCRGVARIWRGGGGGQEFFFKLCMSRSDMLSMTKPCALLGGFGGMPPPREIFLNGAIWCVLVYIWIRFSISKS